VSRAFSAQASRAIIVLCRPSAKSNVEAKKETPDAQPRTLNAEAGRRRIAARGNARAIDFLPVNVLSASRQILSSAYRDVGTRHQKTTRSIQSANRRIKRAVS